MTTVSSERRSVFLKMHPLQRLLLSIGISAAVFFVLPSERLSALMLFMILWVVFAFVFTLTDWIVLFTRPIDQIRKIARQDDGSKIFVFAMIVISSFASLFTVLLLMISGESKTTDAVLFIPLAIAGMLLSWLMIHTVFTFHYAHLYYGDNDSEAAGGLEFPGEANPDYIDFAYFSLVIGCTFQVSDVEISSKKIRRRALVHSLISFVLNTFVVALTINLIAGLSK